MLHDLRIGLLGPLVVERDGQELPDSVWRSRQERRLLGVLLTARGTRVPAERMIAWLWPDAHAETSTISLRSAISSLRQTLEPDREPRQPSHYVLTRPSGYAWNAESGAWIDVDAFLRYLDQSTAIAPTARAARLRAAIDLYRGDYLADDLDAPWAIAMREALRDRYLNALHDLAELHIDAGEYDDAIKLAHCGLAHEPLREPLYRVLMRAYAHAGAIAGALQSYERYRQALDAELGAAPSSQTQSLHAAILRGEEGPASRRTDDTAIQLPGSRPNGTYLSTPALAPPSPSPGAVAYPFVGRSQELAALHGWIADLKQRRGGVVAIVGEAGIGKTRLMTEALGGQQDAFIISLRCVALERSLPFAALREALRPLLRAAPDKMLRRLPPVALAQVAPLLPVLHERVPNLPTLPATPPDESRNQLLDGLVDLGLAVTRMFPLVVCCDDAQWADEATLAVLGRLARHAPRRALLIVLAYRSEELVENAALHALLRSLGREMRLRPVVLSRFDSAEVTQFLAGIAHVQPDRLAHLAARLTESSGGNPLFLAIALQLLVESSGAQSLAALLPNLDAGAPLPDLVSAAPLRDLVLARLEQLAPPTRALLEQLAIIGRPVSLDLIEQIAGAAALEAAQALLERQFLVEDHDGRLAFGHDLVRSIIVATLSSPRRRLLHRQAAEAIAALHGNLPEHAAELAFHFGHAGHGSELDLLRCATRAGDEARQSFGYREALSYYDTAVRAAERLGARAPADDVRRAFAGCLLCYEALLDWDGIMRTSGRYRDWAEIHAAAPPLVATRRLVLLRALMGDVTGAALMSAEEARHQPEPIPAIHDMLWRTARILQPAEPATSHGDWAAFDPAPPLPGAPAEELPALIGHDEAALALFQVGWAALMQGRLNEASPCLRRAYHLALSTRQVAVAVVSALQLAHLNALCGDDAATRSWLKESLDLAARAPEAAWASIWPRIHQAFLLLLDDQHAAAQAGFELMAERLRAVPAFQCHRASVEVGLGLLALARGDHQQAADRLAAALVAPQMLYGFVYVAAQHGLAQLAAARGELTAARTTLAHALDYSARRGLLPEYVRTAIEVARVERDFGDPTAALPLLRRAAALACDGGLTPLATAANTLLTRLAS